MRRTISYLSICAGGVAKATSDDPVIITAGNRGGGAWPAGSAAGDSPAILGLHPAHPLTVDGIHDYQHVADWATWPGFSDAERIAIEYAEKFALDHTALDDSFFRRLHEHYTDEEIMEIAVSVGCWMMMGRITMVMDVNVSCALTLDLGAKAQA